MHSCRMYKRLIIILLLLIGSHLRAISKDFRSCDTSLRSLTLDFCAGETNPRLKYAQIVVGDLHGALFMSPTMFWSHYTRKLASNYYFEAAQHVNLFQNVILKQPSTQGRVKLLRVLVLRC